MSTANPNKLKIKDIITVVLLALINVVIFFASSVLYATPIYHHSDAGVFRPAGGHRLLHHRHEGEKARCDPHLPALSAPLWADTCRTSSSLFSPVPLPSCCCGRWATGNAKALTVSYVIKSGAGCIRQHHHSLRHRSQGYGGSDGHRCRQDAILAASQMLQSWVSVALVAGVIVAAFIGAAIGKGIVKKHLAA